MIHFIGAKGWPFWYKFKKLVCIKKVNSSTKNMYQIGQHILLEVILTCFSTLIGINFVSNCPFLSFFRICIKKVNPGVRKFSNFWKLIAYCIFDDQFRYLGSLYDKSAYSIRKIPEKPARNDLLSSLYPLAFENPPVVLVLHGHWICNSLDHIFSNNLVHKF